MPLAGLENMTGTRLFLASGEPATYTASGFKAMTYSELVGLVSMGPWGDTVADVAEGVVSEDRVIHTNGTRDGGMVPLVVQYRATDAGRTLLETTDGGNALITFRKVFKSGDVECAVGLITPTRSRPVQGDTVRGETLDLKINSARYKFTAAAWAAAV